MANLNPTNQNPQNAEQKKHNTAFTSLDAHRELLKDDRYIAEKKSVFSVIQTYGPVTSRQLALLTGRERSSICRCVYELMNEIQPSIKIAFIKRCPITQRRVKWYSEHTWSLEKQLFKTEKPDQE